MTNREEMLKVLGEYFPITGTTEDFDGSEGGIWICGECDYTTPKGIPYFDYYAHSKSYEFGVLNSLIKITDKHGWGFQWYDPGTIMVYPD